MASSLIVCEQTLDSSPSSYLELSDSYLTLGAGLLSAFASVLTLPLLSCQRAIDSNRPDPIG